MKKIEKIGWVGKSIKFDSIIRSERQMLRYSLWKTHDIFIGKGREETWEREDWPPIKVKITIEEAK